jgi:hypothetical protein
MPRCPVPAPSCGSECPPSLHPDCIRTHLDPEDGDRMFIRNVSNTVSRVSEVGGVQALPGSSRPPPGELMPVNIDGVTDMLVA